MSSTTIDPPETVPGRENRREEHRLRWFVLAVIGLAQLMVVLDATIVNIALPAAQKSLEFSDADRQGWSPPTRWHSAACCCSAGA